MLSQLVSRSRSDSRPRPLQIPGRSTKVRSLIEFYNQKATKPPVITSKPDHDRNRIPSDKVRSLVQNFSRAASVASVVSTSNPSSSRSGGWINRNGTTSPIVLREKPGLSRAGDVRETTPYRLGEITSTRRRSVKGWKSARDQKFETTRVTSEASEPVARKSTRRKRKEGSRHTSLKSSVSPGEPTALPPQKIQPLTAPRLRALESEITRSSSLDMEISMSPRDVPDNDESVASQSSELAVKQRIEQDIAEIDFKAADAEREVSVAQALSIISKHSGSWKEALRSVRDSFRKRPSTTVSSPSTKVSDPLVPYKPAPLKSITDNLAPGSPTTSYLTAPDAFRASAQSPTSLVQTQLNRLESVVSDAENENVLPSDTEQRLNDALNFQKTLQEVSGPSLSQTVEDSNTLSGVGELTAWEHTNSIKRRARTYKSISKQRRTERRPVVNVFRASSPVLSRESPLRPVSPLRVVKDKVKTNSTTRDYTEPVAVKSLKGEPGALLTRVSMETLTSFKELSFPNSLNSSSEVQIEEAQARKKTPMVAVTSTFESLISLASPPPVKPPQEIRSPTLMREMAFPSLSLRDGEEDTPVRMRPALERKIGLGRSSIPKKVIYGDADWRTDRRINEKKIVNEINGRLQEFQGEGSISSYNSQTSSISGAQEPGFTALPKQNYMEAYSSRSEQYGEIEAEPPFLRYTVHPPLPAGTPPMVYPLYQGIIDYITRPPTEGASIIEVGTGGQDEQVRRGRRRTRNSW